MGFTKRTVGNAERGTHPPGLALRRALDDALEQLSDAQRDRFFAVDTGTSPVVRDEASTALATPAMESVELLRRTEATDLGAGTLDELERVIERLSVDYFAVPPADFREQVLSWRRYVARLLDGRLTLAERRDLYAVVGWLSGLLGEVSLAVGDEAQPHCATALSLARQIGHSGLAGWVRGTQAQIALYAGDPREAVTFAQAGRHVAPVGSAALVRACTHEARARARLGDHGGTEIALSAAEDAWSALSQPPVRSIFSFGASYIPYCAATSFVWLRQPGRARDCATQAVEICDSEREPPVGRAIARIDLAIALAQAREPEGASATGLEALDICAERVTLPARRRIGELLTVLRPFPEPSVVELQERSKWIFG